MIGEEQVALDERAKLSKVVQGGDVLILGNRGLGKTTVAQALEKCCRYTGRRVCVLDGFSNWSVGSALSTRRVLRLQNGQLSECGYGRSLTTVWDYQGRSLPSSLLDLDIFDDVILDDWRGVGSPTLKAARPRRIVLAQLLDDVLGRHAWRYVICFNLRFEREISFARRWGGYTLSNLGWGLALLLQCGAPPQ